MVSGRGLKTKLFPLGNAVRGGGPSVPANFVAISDGIVGAYSTDGINWTESTLPSNDSWNSVAYNNGKFVAVAYTTEETAYSTDGINWAASVLPARVTGYAITSGDGKFVMVSDTHWTAYSTNGTNWTEGTTSSVTDPSLTYGNGKFIAVSTDGSDSAMYSTDGYTWAPSSMPSSQPWTSVCARTD